MFKKASKLCDTVCLDFRALLAYSDYNDFAVEARIRTFNEHGIDINYFTEHQIGPILFKEETTFLREILPSEDLKVSIELLGVSLNGEPRKYAISSTKKTIQKQLKLKFMVLGLVTKLEY